MKRIITLFVFSMLSGLTIFAQWIPLNSPSGGFVKSMSQSNDKIYVGLSSGDIYVTGKDLYKWQKIETPFNEHINSIVEHNNVLYAGTPSGLYTTTDNGLKWEKADMGFDSFAVNDIKTFADNIYLATGYGISISKNNGLDWEHLKIYEGDTIPVNGPSANYIEVYHDTLLVGMKGQANHPTEGDCIFISYDNGQKWTNLTTQDIPYKQARSIAKLGDTVFLGTSYGIYKTSLKEIKWEDAGGYTDSFEDIEISGDTLYTITDAGVFLVSSDRGMIWKYAPNNLHEYETYKILKNGNDFLVATTAGVVVSSDKGKTWELINDGINSLSFLDIATDKDNIYLCHYAQGIFGSVDRGETWNDLNTGFTNSGQKAIQSICVNNDTIYTGPYYKNNVYVSTTNGEQWSVFSSLLPKSVSMFIESYNNYIFIGTMVKNGFYRVSKDGSVVDTMTFNNDYEIPAKDFASFQNHLFVATSAYGVLYSDNEGLTWSCISGPTNENIFQAVAYSDGVLYAGSRTGKLYKTSDLGLHWDILYQTPDETAYMSNINVKNDNIFFTTIIFDGITEDCGIKIIKTTGGKCVNISGNIAHRWIYDVEFLGDSIVISTAKGLYKAAISDFENVGVIDGEPLIGNYLYTYPPYPQPAKETVNTLIYWDSKLNINNAEMGVYNFLGAKVCGKERISLSQNSSWSGIVTWDATGTPPGIYFLQIKHGTRTEAIKMLIE